MKKIIILGLVLLMVVVFGTAALAKAEQKSFYNGINDFGIDKTIEGSGGKVIINIPEGEIGMIVQGMVRNLDPNEEYYVLLWAQRDTSWYIGDLPLGKVGSWFRFAMITTNIEGHANFHININTEDLSTGTYDISVWIDEVISGAACTTVLVSYPIKVIIPIP